ncbi:MAG TPA: hypothetical protein VNQ76_11510 [Planctomicrobium sp.]|nr:hypothetical protein [Planctomicrobium sp.]
MMQSLEALICWILLQLTGRFVRTGQLGDVCADSVRPGRFRISPGFSLKSSTGFHFSVWGDPARSLGLTMFSRSRSHARSLPEDDDTGKVWLEQPNPFHVSCS